MPHLLIDRLRSYPIWGGLQQDDDDDELQELQQDGLPADSEASKKGASQSSMASRRPGKRRSISCALVVEIADIFAGIIFVSASVLFLPQYARDAHRFVFGCMLYVVGSVVFILISGFTVAEAWHHCGLVSLETFENMLYFVGSALFVVGTFLYWPHEESLRSIERFKGLALRVYFNRCSPMAEGTVIFILGSALYAVAAFVNSLHVHQGDRISRQLLAATTSLYQVGSTLFVVGSVVFLPSLGGGARMISIGAWCFIIGSAMYLLGAILSLWRTARSSCKSNDGVHEREEIGQAVE